MNTTTDYQRLFIDLFRAVAACEAPEDSQVDGVLGAFQRAYDDAGGRVFVDGEPVAGSAEWWSQVQAAEIAEPQDWSAS